MADLNETRGLNSARNPERTAATVHAPNPPPRSRGAKRLAAVVVCAMLAASLSAVSFSAVASAQSADSGAASVRIQRYGAEDRYATSLRIAQAFVDGEGGSVDDVVMVSGRHWHDAVIAPPRAFALGAPIVMTPPGELRDDTLAFLKDVKAKRVTVVTSGTGDRTTISSEVVAALEAEGFEVVRNPDGDRYEVSAWMAGQIDSPGRLTNWGPSAIIANGEVFADALVAGPVAAKVGVPILLTPRDELHPAAEKYLRDAGIRFVVLMGGTAALSGDITKALGAAGIAGTRMAGRDRYETADLFATAAQDRHPDARNRDSGFLNCSDVSHVGLARGDVPFDSFSAAPLLAQRCAPLVLTPPAKPNSGIFRYFNGFRRALEGETATISVFGGEAAVSQHVLNAYFGATEEADAEDAADEEEPAEPDLSTIEGVFAHAADQRADIVAELTKKIEAGDYGIGDDNVLRGPAGFQIDLDNCPSGWSDATGVTDTEIRIGYTSAQTGILAEYGKIGVGMENYFDWVNENDPVAGRRIVLDTKDDSYVAAGTLEHVEGFVEADNVMSVSNLGSPTTLEVYSLLNDECIPNPFVLSGHPAWGDPVHHPWTTGLQMSYSTEAQMWGTWVEQNMAEMLPVDVAAVVMDNDFGNIYEQAFAAWAKANPDVVASFTPVRHDPAAESLTAEVASVKTANPDVFISMTAGAPCVLAFDAVNNSGLKAAIEAKDGALFAPNVCMSVANYLEPAGDAGDGWFGVAGGVKSSIDWRHADEPFIQFIADNLRGAGLDEHNALYGTGYLYAYPHVETLRIAAELPGGITRTNFILALRGLDLYHPLLLGGIRLQLNGNADAYLIEGSDIAQYDASAKGWRRVGSTLDLNGLTPNCHWDQRAGTCR